MADKYLWMPYLYNPSKAQIISNAFCSGRNTSTTTYKRYIYQMSRSDVHIKIAAFKNEKRYCYVYAQNTTSSVSLKEWLLNDNGSWTDDRTFGPYQNYNSKILYYGNKVGGNTFDTVNVPIYETLNDALAAMDDGNWTGISAVTQTIPVRWGGYGKIYETSFEIKVK